MNTNPLFPTNGDSQDESKPQDADAAVELIRNKVARVFSDEPDAVEEIREVKTARPLSKHQQFMHDLTASGKSLAEIQTAWHHYYTTLSNREKHEVWQEFYEANKNTPYQKLFQKQQPVHSRRMEPAPQPTAPAPILPAKGANEVVVASHETYANQREPAKRAAKSAKLKQKIVNRVSANGKLQAKHHLQSLLFGLGMGVLVLSIFMFTFFNNVIIAPFIQPSRNVSATPIIISDSSSVASHGPTVIIPKINVQIPVNFNIHTNNENVIENALEGGVVHYPSTVLPGQRGNSAFFGHSSNNIFNPGKYKFAFVLLHTLTTGDIFYLTYHGKTYAYQVFAREIVDPSKVSVLNDTKGKIATATLITCDPPGTSLHRLVVWGEQISPNPEANSRAKIPVLATPAPTQLADNGPTLWSRFVNFIEFWK